MEVSKVASLRHAAILPHFVDCSQDIREIFMNNPYRIVADDHVYSSSSKRTGYKADANSV